MQQFQNRYEKYRNFETVELIETKNEDSPNDSDHSVGTIYPNTSAAVLATVKDQPCETPKLANLPTLSVSSPSPPHEEECL